MPRTVKDGNWRGCWSGCWRIEDQILYREKDSKGRSSFLKTLGWKVCALCETRQPQNQFCFYYCTTHGATTRKYSKSCSLKTDMGNNCSFGYFDSHCISCVTSGRVKIVVPSCVHCYEE